MNDRVKYTLEPEAHKVRLYSKVLAVFWTLSVALALTCFVLDRWNSSVELARDYARGILDRDVVYRSWSAGHGGVYAPVTEEMPPNPYLDIDERDITTPSGKKLTLINPSYMTRQVHELAEKEHGVHSHITSLNPIRPENAADPWEIMALKAFEGGKTEVSAIETLHGARHLRLMIPLITQKGCLKCHARQGYKVGDVRGAISVSMPMENIRKVIYRSIAVESMGCVLIWALGLFGIFGGASRINKQIYERINAGKELLKSEEYHRVLYYTSRDALMTLAPPAWRFMAGNSAALRMFNAETEEEFVSQEPWDLSPEYQPDGQASEDKAREMIETAMIKGSNFFEWTHKRISGEEFPASVLLTRMRIGDNTFLQATVRDITVEKRAQEDLNRSEQRYRTVFEGAAEGILVADKETLKFQYSNQAISRMLGYSQEEFSKMTVMQLHPEESLQEVIEAFEAQARGDITLASEIPCLRKDGKIIFADINTTSMDIEGRPCLVGFFSDVTARKKAEADKQILEVELRRRQKLAAVGALAGGAAHEINNPINGIMNYAQLIKDQSDPGSPVADFASEIILETERVASITRKLMALTSKESYESVVIKIDDILESALSPMYDSLKRDQIAIEVVKSSNMPFISCQSARIQKVITILVRNAQEALNERYPKGDKNKIILITTKQIEKDKKLWLRLSVEDHGDGFSAEIRERIFEPFFTTKDRSVGAGTIGRGLGLSTALSIVHDNGGSLDVECEQGQYTRFHLDLMLNKE